MYSLTRNFQHFEDNIKLPHSGPQNLEVNLSSYQESVARNPVGRYFVSEKQENGRYYYLHSDGHIRMSTQHEGKSLGWFHTIHEVQAAINKYLDLQHPPTTNTVQPSEYEGAGHTEHHQD